MKNTLPALFLLISASLLAQTAVPSQIRRVTVFLNGAQVERKAELNIPAGRSEFIIKGISYKADPNSLTVAAGAGVNILSVVHRTNYLEDAPDKEKLQEWERKRKDLLEKIRNQQNAKAVLQFEEDMLRRNQVQVVGVPNNPSGLAELTKLLEFQRVRLAEVLAQQAVIGPSLQALQEQLDLLEKQLAELQIREKRPVGELTLTLDSRTAQRSQLSLGYYVPDAGWNMSYDVRVTDIAKPVSLSYKANIWQQSGEDWNQVELQLSTGNPAESGVRPILQPWYLRPFVEYAMRINGARMPMQNRVPMEKAVDAAGNASEYAEEREQTTSRIYTLDIPYTIASDSKPNTAIIKEISVPAEYEYFCTPKLDRDAFLTAKISNWEELNLMDGEASLFFEGTYAGKTYLSARQTSENLRISLGRDKGIVVERKRVGDFQKKQFLGDKKTLSRGFELIVKNNKPQPVKLILEDQFPLSTLSEVSVERQEWSGGEIDEKTGKVRWELDIPAGANRTQALRYSVKCPKDMDLVLE